MIVSFGGMGENLFDLTAATAGRWGPPSNEIRK